MHARSKLAARIAGIAMVAAGLAVAGQSTAAASAEPTVTVTPSDGLSDGDTVTASVTGFPADGGVLLAQCAEPSPDVVVCNPLDGAEITADATGAASAPLVVRKTYEGYTQDEMPWGPVDCTTIAGGCFIGAADAGQTIAVHAAISFA